MSLFNIPDPEPFWVHLVPSDTYRGRHPLPQVRPPHGSSGPGTGLVTSPALLGARDLKAYDIDKPSVNLMEARNTVPLVFSGGGTAQILGCPGGSEDGAARLSPVGRVLLAWRPLKGGCLQALVGQQPLPFCSTRMAQSP